MTLILKPKGRGNWKALSVSIKGTHLSPLLICIGQLMTLGGIVFRVCEVQA